MVKKKRDLLFLFDKGFDPVNLILLMGMSGHTKNIPTKQVKGRFQGRGKFLADSLTLYQMEQCLGVNRAELQYFLGPKPIGY